MQNVTEQTWPSVRFMKGARWRASSYRPKKLLWVSIAYVCLVTPTCVRSHTSFLGMWNALVCRHENECNVVPHCSFHATAANHERYCNHKFMNALSYVCEASPLSIWCRSSVFLVAMLWMPLAMVGYGLMNVYVEVYGRVTGCAWLHNCCVYGLDE